MTGFNRITSLGHLKIDSQFLSRLWAWRSATICRLQNLVNAIEMGVVKLVFIYLSFLKEENLLNDL